MDRGQVAQSQKQPGRARRARAAAWSRAELDALENLGGMRRFIRIGELVLRHYQPPRGAGLWASAAIILAATGYGIVRGNHVPEIVAQFKDIRDAAASAAGFGIQSVTLIGRHQIAETAILSAVGVTDRASLLFLDLEAARARLQEDPWIAEATLRKLYPGRLQVTIVERDAFALWQKAGKVYVIAADGAILTEPDRRFATLPLVVGIGAETHAKDFLALLDRYPAVRDQVRAAIMVAERRWNLRLKNGIDVKLPETGVEQALSVLAQLDRDKKLLTRDILSVDLRLPDRVGVRLSDAAAQARDEMNKKRYPPKKKGGDA